MPGDKPTAILPDGTCVWHLNYVRHRNNHKPALMLPSGVQEWWEHGHFHGWAQVTDFRKDSLRYAFVTAVLC